MVTITIPNMEVTITGDAQLCFGETTILAVDGAYQAYHWSTGDDDPGIEVISSGIYTVTVTASNGCTAVANWSVAVLDAIEAVWEAQSPSCYNYQDGMIELGAVSGGISPYAYRINSGAWATSEVFPNLPAGTWYLGVEDSNGCRGQDTLTLLNPLPILVDLGNDLTIEAGETTTLSPSVSPTGLFMYTWTPSSGLSCTQCLQPETTVFSDTRYTFQVVNEQGCTASDSIMIRVLLPDGSIYVPTIFAPDDEKRANNYFTVYGDPLFTGKIEYLRVYDRWGGLVYEGKGLPVDGNSTGWDGNSRGRPAPSGVYIWEAKIQFLNGNVVVKKGDITLLR